ncbi:hypothetical protein J4216_03295 [Candidatus Woesearchaeota archaeon]|nr:hypothetical protein [Candidatus Woesearchaeota archaeon]
MALSRKGESVRTNLLSLFRGLPSLGTKKFENDGTLREEIEVIILNLESIKSKLK